jgi:hypothetical protein
VPLFFNKPDAKADVTPPAPADRRSGASRSAGLAAARDPPAPKRLA